MKRSDYANIITKEVKANTKQAEGLRQDAQRWGRWTWSDIYEAYESPSVYKVRSFKAIEDRARNTEGYNNDLRIIGKNCMQYSTIYTFTEGSKTYIVKDTKDNCYITEA
jgi:hypothetical protein